MLNATYTGTFSVTGDSNNIDFNCDSAGNNSSCGTSIRLSFGKVQLTILM